MVVTKDHKQLNKPATVRGSLSVYDLLLPPNMKEITFFHIYIPLLSKRNIKINHLYDAFPIFPYLFCQLTLPSSLLNHSNRLCHISTASSLTDFCKAFLLKRISRKTMITKVNFSPGWEKRVIALARASTHHIKNASVVCHMPKLLYVMHPHLLLIHSFLITLYYFYYNPR